MVKSPGFEQISMSVKPTHKISLLQELQSLSKLIQKPAPTILSGKAKFQARVIHNRKKKSKNLNNSVQNLSQSTKCVSFSDIESRLS